MSLPLASAGSGPVAFAGAEAIGFSAASACGSSSPDTLSGRGATSIFAKFKVSDEMSGPLAAGATAGDAERPGPAQVVADPLVASGLSPVSKMSSSDGTNAGAALIGAGLGWMV
jgi:hypothetical protein